MRRILIISFSRIETDPRIQRQIVLLKDKFRLVVAGYGTFQAPDMSMVSLQENGGRGLFARLSKAADLLLGTFRRHYWRQESVRSALKELAAEDFDVVLANDIDALPLALRIAKSAPVVLDAHEYSPKEFEGWKWRLFFQRYKSWLCREYLPLAHSVCTVSKGLADAYQSEFGISCTLVMNASQFRDIEPSPVDEEHIRLIHHGGINRSRQIERMIDMMSLLDDRFTLDLMLMRSDARYLNELKIRAAPNPRIRFVEPVSLKDIPSALNRYDMGLYLLPFSNFNNKHALPNKFFEFVQGRLGIAIGPSPEMARLVTEYDLGIVASDFAPATMAKALMDMSADQVRLFKANSHRAAAALSSEASGQELMRLIEHAASDGREMISC